MRPGQAKVMVFAALAASLMLLTTFQAGPPQAASASRPVRTPSPTVEPTPSPTPEPPRWYYGGREVDGATTDITVLPEGEITELAGLAGHMPNLRTIRFGGREPDAGELALLAEAFPQADVDYSVTLGGVYIRSGFN